MRWLLPFVLSVALAAGEADVPTAAERRRRRAARERHAGRVPAIPVVYDASAFESQSGAFDPKAGTLTWFDDDVRYN
jgi:hypothetical protein